MKLHLGFSSWAHSGGPQLVPDLEIVDRGIHNRRRSWTSFAVSACRLPVSRYRRVRKAARGRLRFGAVSDEDVEFDLACQRGRELGVQISGPTPKALAIAGSKN